MAKERKSSIARRARRKALALIGGALTAPWILSSAVRAQAAWPSRTVRYINPYPPGGPTDTLSRLFPDRRVVPVACENLVWGMGAIHCVTQQQPKVVA